MQFRRCGEGKKRKGGERSQTRKDSMSVWICFISRDGTCRDGEISSEESLR